MICEECKQLGIPEYLCKNDKPLIENFANDESLYRRHPFKGTKQELKDKEDIINEIFKIHDDSYNKSSLSNAIDVLLNDNPQYHKDIYLKHGIIKVNVANLLNEAVHIIDNDPRKFSLVPIHKPIDCNYSHCEIHCVVDGVKAAKKPRSVNTVFRKILSNIFEVIREAS